MIAGLEEATSGDIFIDNKLVNNIAPKDRDISMVFQNYALYPHMTVYENMAFGLKLRKYKKADIRKRVNEAAEILEIKDLLKRKPKQLSGGQRQRVALGRAIVRKPAVFLFDEPLSNLDAKLRVQMRTEIKKLHKQLKTTMIYVTHDQTEAMTMGDRIAVMKDGFIHQLDTPMNIYNNPNDVFVAGFIGSPAMNFFDVQIDEKNVIIDEKNRIPVTKNLLARVEEFIGHKTVMGIRPENISIIKKNENYFEMNFNFEILEPMGSEILIYMNNGKTGIICRTDNFESISTSKDTITVFFNMEKVHFWD